MTPPSPLQRRTPARQHGPSQHGAASPSVAAAMRRPAACAAAVPWGRASKPHLQPHEDEVAVVAAVQRPRRGAAGAGHGQRLARGGQPEQALAQLLQAAQRQAACAPAGPRAVSARLATASLDICLVRQCTHTPSVSETSTHA